MKVDLYFDYIQGHIRNGHMECDIPDEEYHEMTDDERKWYVRENGKLVIDDYEVDDFGDIYF